MFFGRLAAFPSTLMAAAAGASGVPPREFLPADTAGALVSMGALLGVGYVLGEAYEEAGPWITAVGVRGAGRAAGDARAGRCCAPGRAAPPPARPDGAW